MDTVFIFAILGILIIGVSWRTIFNVRSHGFYRFLSWLCIAWLLANNYRDWFSNPFSIRQIVSWIFLIISGYLVIAGVILLKQRGKQTTRRDEPTLYPFEQTTKLVDKGIFHYIRHPMYSSLLFLTWGIYLKRPST